MDNFSVTQKTVLSLLAHTVSGTEYSIPEDVSLPDVWNEAHFQTVKPLVFSDIDLSCLDEAFQQEVHTLLRKRLMTNVSVANQHNAVHRVLTDANIPYTIIKGCASASYYPDPFLRPLGDVDFLVAPEDIPLAEKTLLENGFRKVDHKHDVHEIYIKNGVRFELHSEPAGIPHGKTGELVREYLSDTIETANLYSGLFGEMMMPDVFHHGLIILLHTAHHLTGEGVGLRQVADWAVFINSVQEEVFLSLFEKKLTECGLWDFCRILTALCIRYLGIHEMNFAADVNNTLIDNLLLDIFNGGNFGQKDTDRSHEAMLISSHGKDGVGKKSKLFQLFTSANDIVYTKWKIARKIKLLLPLGWLIYGGRYIIRSLFGKRPKIEIRKTVEEAEKRIGIYKELHLFETEED